MFYPPLRFKGGFFGEILFSLGGRTGNILTDFKVPCAAFPRGPGGTFPPNPNVLFFLTPTPPLFFLKIYGERRKLI